MTNNVIGAQKGTQSNVLNDSFDDFKNFASGIALNQFRLHIVTKQAGMQRMKGEREIKQSKNLPKQIADWQHVGGKRKGEQKTYSLVLR